MENVSDFASALPKTNATGHHPNNTFSAAFLRPAQ